MAVYRVDFILSLYHTEYIDAPSADVAKELAESMLDNDRFLDDLMLTYDDPTQTDWLGENVEVSVDDYVESIWEATVNADGSRIEE